VLGVLGDAYLWEFVVGLLLGEPVGGEFFGWQEPDSFGGNRNPAGIWRNPKESRVIWWKYRNSYLAGIPAKKYCKSGWKQEFSRPLQNHVPVKQKNGKKSSGILCFSVFQSQK
jgi:hypothetical protein